MYSHVKWLVVYALLSYDPFHAFYSELYRFVAHDFIAPLGDVGEPGQNTLPHLQAS